MSEESTIVQNPSRQGWQQFLTARKQMLDAFDKAKIHDSSHKVQTHRGNVAEAQCRQWLSDFLPKKYGVTSGYVISQGEYADTKAPHFDVIIYQVLESPVLWIESSPDSTLSGQSRAIPAEYVCAIIEVKSSFNSTSASKAIKHLFDLQPLLADVDDPSERYRRYLPADFFSGIIFFELKKRDKTDYAALEKFVDTENLRGFFGGLILRGEQLPPDVSGKIIRMGSIDPNGQPMQPRKDKSIMGGVNTVQVGENIYWGLIWTEMNFSTFAFDLLAKLNGTYIPNRLSSFHGIGSEGLRAAEQFNLLESNCVQGQLTLRGADRAFGAREQQRFGFVVALLRGCPCKSGTATGAQIVRP